MINQVGQHWDTAVEGSTHAENEISIHSKGENMTAKEATPPFFAMTKLFQSKDAMVRRMVYLFIKEMANIADDVIIVTSSLTKDMTGKEDHYRGPAIRALCKITDVCTFSRYNLVSTTKISLVMSRSL